MPGGAPRLTHTPSGAAGGADFQPPYFPPPYIPSHSQQAVDFAAAHDPYHALHHPQHYQHNMLRQREELQVCMQAAYCNNKLYVV